MAGFAISSAMPEGGQTGTIEQGPSVKEEKESLPPPARNDRLETAKNAKY